METLSSSISTSELQSVTKRENLLPLPIRAQVGPSFVD